MTQPETEFQELTHPEDKPATVPQDITQPLMDHASNPTATLILSVLNANKASNFASNVSLPETELSNSQKASVSVWTDTTPTPTILVFHANQDAESVLQPLTVLPALLCQLPMLMDHALAPTKLTSLSQPMESDIVLLVELTVSLAQMPPLVLLVKTPIS